MLLPLNASVSDTGVVNVGGGWTLVRRGKGPGGTNVVWWLLSLLTLTLILLSIPQLVVVVVTLTAGRQEGPQEILLST